MDSPKTLKEVRERMMEVVKQCPSMILAFKSRLVTDEMWEYAIAMEPALFKECKHKTYRLAAVAITLDGFHLGNIDPVNYTESQYENLCKLAISQNPKAISIVPKEFRTDELVSMAYARDPSLLLSEKKLSEDMVISILDHNPSLIRYVVNPTDEMMIHALRKDPRTIVYFATISDTVRAFFEENYPQYAAMYLHD